MGDFITRDGSFAKDLKRTTEDLQGVSLARVGIFLNNCYCSYWEPQIIEVI